MLIATDFLTNMLRTLVVLSVIIFSFQGASVNGVPEDEFFDFIVVGGGVAGCTVASRLSENGKYTVLLLESGPLPDPDLDVPALTPNVSLAGNFIKMFNTVPQNANLIENGIVPYPVGSALGGGSAVNMMFFNRGSPHDYDNWARMTGDTSWSYRNMMKYFKRIEDYQGDFTTNQHGYGGPITVSRPRYSPGLDIWLEAGEYLGYPADVDQNGPQKISFTRTEFSKKFGRRVSAYTGYIKPVMNSRPNLKVIVGAHVTRVLFQVNRAIGVVYRMNSTSSDRVNFVRARREVILSAGVIGSPTLLLKSGIGPKDVLKEAKISPVAILPVGQNLHDHVSLQVEFVANKSHLFHEPRDLNEESWNTFELMGDGPYTSYGGHSQAFIRSPQKYPDPYDNDQWPNLHIAFLFGGVSNAFIRVRDDIKMAKWEGPGGIFTFLTRPKSRGFLKLNSSNIEEDPVIDFQYLNEPQDLEDLLYAIKVGLQLIETTPSFGKVGARYPPNPLPPCKHLKFRSDAYWRCYIRQTAVTGAHGAGSCRMGSGPLDPDAVVDTNLRVIGILNLRVVDTSIMPTVVNANTQVGAYAIAEKAADMILKSNR